MKGWFSVQCQCGQSQSNNRHKGKKPDNIYILIYIIYTHTICSTHDLHKADLEIFFFSRYPSVALARNRRAKMSSGSDVARTPRTQSAPRSARKMPGNLHAGARNENVDRHITLLSSDIFSGPDTLMEVFGWLYPEGYPRTIYYGDRGLA